jgi:hypothetical protein
MMHKHISNTEYLKTLPKNHILRDYANNNDLRMYKEEYLNRSISKELRRRELYRLFRFEKKYSYEKSHKLSRSVL